MGKIWLIVQREYITRVRNKTFIVMSILGPLLIAAFYAIIFWTASSSGEEKFILVIDESHLFENKFVDSKKLHFSYEKSSLDEAKKEMIESKRFDAVLFIPQISLENPQGITIFSEKGLAAITKELIERTIENELESVKLEKLAGINKETLKTIDTDITINTIGLSEEGEKDISTGASTVVGLMSGLAIYMFVFLYGVQVMRGVMEEKTNRIVEVMISSVKPFQLMMGKIIGIAGVGLTQIMIWIILGIVVVSAFTFIFVADTEMIQQAQEISQQMPNINAKNTIPINEGSNVMFALSTINFPLLISCFVFYFLFGYLLYAALFGAIGAAVDSETDTQQLMLPVTIPLILSISLSSAIISEPNGQLAFWLSIIPLTSPVAMMVRVPFIGFGWELILSISTLILGFLGATWMAAKIYRVGILMYGKKVTYKELAKWLFYK
ncbi:MAG: ABC transporter permease [Flammeovirgaceae bacterium]